MNCPRCQENPIDCQCSTDSPKSEDIKTYTDQNGEEWLEVQPPISGISGLTIAQNGLKILRKKPNEPERSEMVKWIEGQRSPNFHYRLGLLNGCHHMLKIFEAWRNKAWYQDPSSETQRCYNAALFNAKVFLAEFIEGKKGE